MDKPVNLLIFLTCNPDGKSDMVLAHRLRADLLLLMKAFRMFSTCILLIARHNSLLQTVPSVMRAKVFKEAALWE